MSQLHSDTYAPSAAYLKQIKYLQESASTALRYATVRGMVEQAKVDRTQPARRLRMIWDMAHLLRPSPSSASGSNSTPVRIELSDAVMGELNRFVTQLVQSPPEDAPEGLIRDIQTLATDAQRTTWTSFQRFAESDVGSRTFTLTESLDDLAAYEEWLAQALTAIGLDLPDDLSAQGVELVRRMEFLLSKIAASDEPEDDTFGLRDRFGRDISLYVLKHRTPTETDAD